ncbi:MULTISPECIES: TraE/TraK family type IV conjugative transfer system protein [unclassified Novosphingobium]|uniref:TraE/TraK family type IV conjugative transfer system protein n=1 Tax=unclassified Novosphingobium TaxID=2644732 RepID=UPI000D322628|nr:MULTISPECIES: TraE/TraK family type IV conjugative transfer system protein [unclassified Novosphingobium]PTR12599.1 conjugal transfer pilus assembly protein TraE [Novosphingobium sp. GV055]PUB06383.1 conjugal transfer pilus assembly protein TraE [Novosphingobium sp. GV061]PUB22434.1 conjugal transfer pilus assembly protein TraE [Novosphingobium sp. GV079]PUB44459.1 conjugal transfer pilus assembly protein TraE [Novosphingobium sp. GV027]
MSFLKRKPPSETDPLLGKPASFGIHRYLQGSANLFEENRLLKFAIVGLFGITTVLGAEIYSSDQNRRTVIVPFGAGGDLYVTGTKPSADYMSAMTRNVVALSGTYSAYSADQQFQALLGIAHPSAYNSMRDSLNAILDELAANPTFSIATYIRGDQPVTWTNTEITVPVEKVRVIGGVIRKFRGNLRIGYAIENGRFWLTHLIEDKFDAENR